MKAILNIQNKNNQYAKFNGQTFEVGDLLNGIVGLKGLNPEYPDNQTDFTFADITLCDIETEMQTASKIKNEQCNFDTIYNEGALKYYCKIKGINLKPVFH